MTVHIYEMRSSRAEQANRDWIVSWTDGWDTHITIYNNHPGEYYAPSTELGPRVMDLLDKENYNPWD